MNEINKMNKNEKMVEYEAKLNAKHRIETILRLYSVIGALISVFAIAYFLLSLLEIQLTKSQQLTLIVAGTGISISLTSWALLLFRKQKELDVAKEVRSLGRMSELITLWANFESESKLSLDVRDVEYNKRSIKQIIKLLVAVEILDLDDRRDLEEAMQIRNSAAHSERPLEPQLIKKAIFIINNALNKLNYANEAFHQTR